MTSARRRPTSRRKHKVNVSLQAFDISKAGTSLDLEIYADEEKLGDIRLGRGSINWRGRNRQSFKRITWSRFAEMMDELAYGVRK